MTAPLISLPAYPTVSETVGSIQQYIDTLNSLITNFNSGGVSKTYIEAIAIALGSDASTIPGSAQAGAYEMLAQLASAEFILTASGTFLDLKAADVGIVRKPSTAASDQVQFSQNPPPAADLLIPAGTVCSAEPADPTQPPILFTTNSAITYLAGQQNSPLVDVTCQTSGSVGNVDAGAINTVLSGPGGLFVTNPLPAGGGNDQEQDDSPNGGLRARALAAIPNASQCTQSAIVGAAVSYAGVTSAFVLDNTDSDGVTFLRGKVQLYIDDGSGNLGANNPTLVAQIQADFNAGKFRAAGVQVDVHGSSEVFISIAFTVNPSLVYTQTIASASQVLANAAQAVFDFVKTLPLGRAVTVAGVVEAAGAAAGVANVVVGSVLINGGSADFVPLPQQAARCLSVASVTVSNAGTSAVYG